MRRVLLFDRPHTDYILKRVLSEVFNEACEYTILSEYRNYGANWVGDFVYDKHYDSPNDVPGDSVVLDVIQRDRVLRGIDREIASSLVRRYWHAIDRLFDEKDFDLVASLSIDCYLIDVLYRVADIHRVPILSFIGSFMSEYTRFTLRGERQELDRAVGEEEVVRVLNRLTDPRFLPDSQTNNMTKRPKDLFRYYLHRKISEKIYHPLWRKLNSDPYHTVMSVEVFRNLKWNDVWDCDFEGRFTRLTDLDINQNCIYLPMHLIPEATTDYWCPDIAKVGYEDYIANVVQSSPEMRFLIKEHPAMYGLRNLSFYDRLLSFGNVSLVHPLDSSNVLLEKVENVIVDNGTVGIEAALREKTVLALCESYYSDLHPAIALGQTMQDYHSSDYALDEANVRFIKRLLSCHFFSDYRNDESQAGSDIFQLAHGARLYLARIGLV